MRWPDPDHGTADNAQENYMSSISLKTKITVAMAAFTLVVILALGCLAISFFRAQLRSNIMDQQYAHVSSLAAEIDDKLLSAQVELKSVAQIFPADFSQAQHILENRLDTRQFFQNALALTDASGRLLALAPMEKEMFQKNLGTRDYFLKTVQTGEPTISDPFITLQKHRHPIVMFTAPIFNHDSSLKGMLLGTIDLTSNNFLGKLSNAKVGNSGHFYLFNTKRTILMGPDRNDMLRENLPTGINPLLDRAISGFEGSEECTLAGGRPVLASFKRLKATDWILCASTPVSEAYGPITHANKVLLGALSVATLISVLLACTIINYLTIPLARFTDHVRLLMGKEGEDRFFQYQRDDEIGLLAKSFNAMMAKLGADTDALRRSEQRLATAFNAIPECITISRLKDGMFLEVNHAFEKTTEYRRDEAIGRTSLELALWCCPEARETMLSLLKANGYLDNWEMEYQKKSGEVGTMLLSASPFEYYGESSLLLSLRDISAMKAVEKELQKKQAELIKKHEELERAHEELKTVQGRILQHEKMASIGLLAAGVAHELNNPIAFVTSNLSTLKKYTSRMHEFMDLQTEKLALLSPDQLQELEERKKNLKLDRIVADIGFLLEESLDGADRVRCIVRDLRMFSRKNSEESQAANLNECLLTTLNIVWNEIKYNVTVIKDLGDLPLTWCLPQQLNQVFLNLIVNAAHAIEKQGEITISSWHEDGYISISIADNGCGIAPEIQKQVFEPFFTTKEPGRGTGLGLSISYEIVMKHRGELTVQSQSGKGTRFLVRLPVCPSAEALAA